MNKMLQHFSGLLMLLSCAACASTSGQVNSGASQQPVFQAPTATRSLGQASRYISPAGERLEVVHDPRAGIAIVKLPGGGLELLNAELAGSEERYRSATMTLWENNGTVLLWQNGSLLFSGAAAAGVGN